MIKLIIGLGNPGVEYSATRHNAGFWMIDKIARLFGEVMSNNLLFNGFYANVRIYGNTVHLFKPNTYMNCSGKPVIELIRFFKILPNQILIAHDELDLSPGITKLKLGGSLSGHNGLKNISEHLSSQQYWRLRIGIGHPRNLVPESKRSSVKHDIALFVLGIPQKKEKDLIEASIRRVLTVIPLIVKGELEQAMMYLHRNKLIEISRF
ncbi:MAG: aminoacyl-tRNA hydrolase [Burkholderia sp.]|nr:aminoacyl-tRNA hydrolase [Burkholderia sp.]